MQPTEQRRNAKFSGGLAQLGEHLLCKQGVVGSIPSSSTNPAEIKGKQQHADAYLWPLDRVQFDL